MGVESHPSSLTQSASIIMPNWRPGVIVKRHARLAQAIKKLRTHYVKRAVQVSPIDKLPEVHFGGDI